MNFIEQRATQPYQLPDGRVVRVYADTARGLPVIGFTLHGGEVVDAFLVDETARLSALAAMDLHAGEEH